MSVVQSALRTIAEPVSASRAVTISPGVNIRVVPGRAALQTPYFEAWREILKRTPSLANPLFCPEFIAAVSEVRNDVCIGVLEKDGTICGFFPFQRNAFGFGTPVGAMLSDYQAMIAASDTRWDPCEILRGCNLRAWDFDHLIASQSAWAPFHRIRTLSPCIDLEHGYDAYIREHRRTGSTQVQKAMGLSRRLEREFGKLRFEPSVTDCRYLELLLKWKSEQYLRSAKRDLFSVPWIRRLVENLHKTQTGYFAGAVSVLWAGDTPVAAHFGMRSRTVWHYWFPAYDPGFSKFSPGIILLLKMAENASDIGAKTIDLGKGQSLYKNRLMNSAVELAEGSVERRSIVTALRRCRSLARMVVLETPLIYPARAIRSFVKNFSKLSAIEDGSR